MKKLLILLVLLQVSPWAAFAETVEKRIKRLEEEVEKLDLKIGLLTERSNLLAERTQISFLNASYIKTGLTLLFPRGANFSYSTDTGLGVFVGGGHYFGRNHVLDGSFDWDLYPALTLRYRYEWRNKNETLNIGPVIGLKAKLSDQKPLDKYLDPREELKSIYGVVGIGAGFPLGLSLVQTEILAFFNQQLFINASLGIHFFL